MNVERIEAVDDMLNEVYPEVVIGGITFSPADILAELDPVAYNCMASEYIDDNVDEEEEEDE